MFGITGAIENAVEADTLRDWVFTADGHIALRPPRIDDGAQIHALVLNAAPLEPNTLYAYLLLCRDFADTCLVAEHEGGLVAFVSGYRRPGQANTLFIWQVAVEASMRGRRLGRSMLLAILNRRSSRGITMVESTVSPSNAASQALFRGLARALGTGCREEVLFHAGSFGGSEHEEEVLFSIGPFDRRAVRRADPDLKRK